MARRLRGQINSVGNVVHLLYRSNEKSDLTFNINENDKSGLAGCLALQIGVQRAGDVDRQLILT